MEWSATTLTAFRTNSTRGVGLVGTAASVVAGAAHPLPPQRVDAGVAATAAAHGPSRPVGPLRPARAAREAHPPVPAALPGARQLEGRAHLIGPLRSAGRTGASDWTVEKVETIVF
eukprot:1067042-Prorocentrum_minimum.AAC.1